MKEGNIIEYTTLFDKSGKKRGVVCVVANGFVGISFRSDEDRWSEKSGQNIARNRAHRVQRFRKPCYVNRQRVVNYIMDLRRDSLGFLMNITNNMLSGFPKGFARSNKKNINLYEYTKSDGENGLW